MKDLHQPAKASSLEDVLRECGVNQATLASGEKADLDRLGYILLPGAVDDAWLGGLRAAFEKTLGQGSQVGTAKQTGTRHVGDLAYRDAAFDRVYTHPKVLAAAHHVLRRPFKVFQLSGRDPLPGFGQQGLHTDWLPRAPSEPFEHRHGALASGRLYA